jgi:hypothetical protein
MASSTIPAFKAALLTRLQADADLAGLDITYGVPAPRGPEREWVWLGGAREDQATAAMGQRRREETWVQDIVVSCLKPVREDQQTLTERAFEIAGVIEDSLRDWSQLTSPPVFGGVVREALVVRMDLDELLSIDREGVPQEREARITISLACKQRI